MLSVLLISAHIFNTIEENKTKNQPSPARLLGRQKHLVHSAVAPNYRTDRPHAYMFKRYLNIGENIDSESICSWRGFHCDSDGTLESIIMTQITVWGVRRGQTNSNLIRFYWFLDLDFLPPSVQFVYLSAIQLGYGWSPHRLPRDMRFLFLENCSIFQVTDAIDVLKFHVLPAKMEELHILHGWLQGTVRIDALPPQMRFIQLVQLQSMPSVIIDSRALHDKFNLAVIRCLEGKVNIKEVSGGKRDARVQTRGEVNSELCGMYQREVRGIYDMFLDMFRGGNALRMYELT